MNHTSTVCTALFIGHNRPADQINATPAGRALQRWARKCLRASLHLCGRGDWSCVLRAGLGAVDFGVWGHQLCKLHQYCKSSVEDAAERRQSRPCLSPPISDRRTAIGESASQKSLFRRRNARQNTLERGAVRTRRAIYKLYERCSKRICPLKH